MGSRLAKGYIAETDAYLTTRFKEAGAIILGRTTTPELGFAATTESILTGATRNPWDLNLIAGGSSGGSAAAVAAGIVPVAHACDGGGSIVIRARAALNMTRRKVGAFFEKYDLLLTPTTAQLPVPLNTIHQNQDIPLEAWYLGTSQFNAFTGLFNATGLPAISLPLCQSSAGLPIGIQFVAGFGQEDLLIRVASAFEEALPWADHKPPIHVDTL